MNLINPKLIDPKFLDSLFCLLVFINFVIRIF